MRDVKQHQIEKLLEAATAEIRSILDKFITESLHVSNSNFAVDIDIGKLGVYELRKYAKSIGVSRPTAKTVANLKKEIEYIKVGKLEPCHNNNRGRPAKSLYFDTVQSEDISILKQQLKDLVKAVNHAYDVARKSEKRVI